MISHPFEPVGARESGAGDQFHFLWAARRAIELLNPASDLKLVRLEGFSPNAPVAADADLLLGVDLVEYFGDATFEGATTIVVSQLKYSHRHPDKAWTAARMCDSGRGAGSSVCRRLAEAFAALSKQGTRAATRERVLLKLVSNQPVSTKLKQALNQARAMITTGRRDLSTQDVIEALPKQQALEITRLRDCAGLQDRDFVDFLYLLDLGECGAESRDFQELRLAAEIARHLPGDVEPATDRLYRKIESEALPEGKMSFGLSLSDLLVTFGVHSAVALFPVPARLQTVEHPIMTSDARGLAARLLDTTSVHLIAHGDAGVGKTTTLTLLESQLPSGSVVVIYDCFGGGSYLEPSEGRHLPQRAILQMRNELFTRLWTPLLVKPPQLGPDLWSALKTALDAAADKVAAAGGLLVLAIDAADNAAFAARQSGDQWFLPELWRLALPVGVRVVVTARTHRVAELQAPTGTSQFELIGFAETDSAAFLRRRFTAATDEECTAFHARTGGNPRVQFYVLDPVRSAQSTLENVLDNSSRTPEAIVKDIVDAVITEVPDQSRAKEVLGNLVCSSRPVSIASFANVSDLTVEEGTSFCHGLAPGLRISDGLASFGDEDFETYVRGEIGLGDEIAAHRRLASFYMTRDRVDEEAASVVAEHLYRGEQYSELVALTLDRGEPSAIADSVVRLQVYRRRLTFALRAALVEGKPEDAFRLTVLAGEAARSDSALQNIIREHPDLAMHHGDPRGVAEVYLRQENRPWRGPLHLRISAMYAREGEFGPADEHFAHANAWLREAVSKTNDETDEWRISIDDIAAGAEAVYWRHGLDRALKWLRRWRPDDAVFVALNGLAIALVNKCDLTQLEQEVSSVRMSARFEAVFRGRLWAAGVMPSAERVQHLVDLVERSLQRQPMEFVDRWRGDYRHGEAWLLEFTEMAASVGLGAEQLLRLLRQAAPSLPQHAPSEWADLTSESLSLRMHALDSVLRDTPLTVGDLIPERLREDPEAAPTSHDKDAEERRRYREVFGEVLPAFMLRAQVLTNTISADDVKSAIEGQLSRRRESAESRGGRFDKRFRLWAMTAGDAVLRTSGLDAAAVIQDMADVAEKAAKGSAPSLWLDLASLSLRRLPSARVEGLIDRAVVSTEGQELPASDRVQTLLRATSLAEVVDPSVARDYYARALAVAAGIDDDSIALLEMHARLATRLGPTDTRSAEIAARMAGLIEDFENRVSDPDRLPRAATVEAMAALHPPTAFATVSRWDDEDRLDIEDSIAPLVLGSTAHGFVRADIGASLLQIAGDRLNLFEAVVPLLERLKSQGEPGRAGLIHTIDELSLRIRRDLALWSRGSQARQLAEWALQAGLASRSSVKALERLADYTEVARVVQTSSAGGRIERRAPDQESVWPTLATADNLRDQLEALAEGYPTDDVIAAYIVDSGRAIAPRARVAFLEVLGSLLPADRIMRWHSRGVSQGLCDLVRDWRRSAPTMRWAKVGVPAFIEGNLVALIGRDMETDSGLDRLLALPLGEDTTTLLLRAVAASLDEMSSHQLFAVAGSLAALLNDGQVANSVLWSISRLESSARAVVEGLPSTYEDTISAFLFALFGNVDKRKRWRAAHFARSLLQHESQSQTDAMMAFAAATSAGSFVSPRHVFYWLSARQWLMLVVARLAGDSPDKLRSHLDVIADIATDTALPHASIRDMAKRAALAVHVDSSGGLSAEKLELVRLSNEPTGCFVERKHRYSRSRVGEEPDLRFKFDSGDTLPYWYSPLANVFELATSEVSIRAEKWIVDHFGYSEEDTWKDRRELARERQWQLTSNYHGTIPVLESLEIYLTYHAMLLAAGQIIDEGLPVACDERDEPDGPWGYWLSHHVESSPDWWLSDLRSPTPLEPYIYGEPLPLDEWRAVGSDDFDRLLTVDPDGEKRLVVHSYVTTRSADRHEYLYVRTALVSPETSHALMRALQTADPNAFLLPYEGSDDSFEGRREILDGEFVLEGLLENVSVERESIEERDPLARIRYSFNRPGEAYLKYTGARKDRTGLKWMNDSGDLVAEMTLWNDGLGYEREPHEHQTEGTRTTVPVEAMLQFLAATGRTLVIDVEVDRKDDRRDEGSDGDYEPARSRIYLLTKDGQIESLEGTRSL